MICSFQGFGPLFLKVSVCIIGIHCRDDADDGGVGGTGSNAVSVAGTKNLCRVQHLRPVAQLV